MIKITPLVIGMTIALIAYFLINSIFFNKEQSQIKPNQSQHPYYQMGTKMCECTSILDDLNIQFPTSQIELDSAINSKPYIAEDYKLCMQEFYNLGRRLQLDSSGYSGIENRVIPKDEIKENYTKGFESKGCDIENTVFELE